MIITIILLLLLHPLQIMQHLIFLPVLIMSISIINIVPLPVPHISVSIFDVDIAVSNRALVSPPRLTPMLTPRSSPRSSLGLLLRLSTRLPTVSRADDNGESHARERVDEIIVDPLSVARIVGKASRWHCYLCCSLLMC
ncbi:hypothetical protein BDV96DRAFT_581384 [Lophiotrema nucula]|uniref:Uncharacterized protein n=1 Tax=Lophiotrema nucula TaxID=690887 RepID=A0A6A5YYP5_9PLEO|nr:hypothetical protein BDV96DRAFT_581384 [Lophiotrema nucula]